MACLLLLRSLRMSRTLKILIVFYLSPVICVLALFLALFPPAAFFLGLGYAVYRFWNGESLQELLKTFLVVGPFVALLVIGIVQIESYPLVGPEIKEVYLESEGRYARCGTVVALTKIGAVQIWIFFVWFLIALSRKLHPAFVLERRPPAPRL